MYSVSDLYKELSGAHVREYHLIFTCYHLVNNAYEHYATYPTDEQPIISAKIIIGQTTGGFSIGGTVCASLEMTAANNTPIKTNDKISVFVVFETPYAHTGSTEALSLGEFYVDSVRAGTTNTKIIALDRMIKLTKEYNSSLTYPSTVSKALDEISTRTNTPVSDDIDLFNDAGVGEKPVKGQDNVGTNIYFTQRETLGYIAGINGGNAYIDKDGKINFSTPKETDVAIDYSSVISQTLGDTSLEITKISRNTSGMSQSTSQGLENGTVELYYPLVLGNDSLDVLTALTKRLNGLKYDSVTLKKQGTGVFQLGDMISYKAADNKVYKILIMGIVYEFSGGFFSETLYSLAKSESQKQYAGVENISQNISSSGTNGVTPQSIDKLISPSDNSYVQYYYAGNLLARDSNDRTIWNIQPFRITFLGNYSASLNFGANNNTSVTFAATNSTFVTGELFIAGGPDSAGVYRGDIRIESGATSYQYGETSHEYGQIMLGGQRLRIVGEMENGTMKMYLYLNNQKLAFEP